MMIAENAGNIDVEPKCIHDNRHIWIDVEDFLIKSDDNIAMKWIQYCLYCGSKHVIRDLLEGPSKESYYPADEKSSIWVLQRALKVENDILPDWDSAAYDWAVSILTDVENEYDDITQCMGYSDPRNMEDVLAAIHRLMLFFPAAEALGSDASIGGRSGSATKDSVTGSTLDSVYFHAPDHLTKSEVMERIGDQYKIRWISDRGFCIEVVDRAAGALGASNST